ncbi:hypothetical protein CLAFUR4_00143 [Fulvia fulva]|nr:hypothetical protein CLAFUR4_00143 [Fulvia fulva]
MSKLPNLVEANATCVSFHTPTHGSANEWPLWRRLYKVIHTGPHNWFVAIDSETRRLNIISTKAAQSLLLSIAARSQKLQQQGSAVSALRLQTYVQDRYALMQPDLPGKTVLQKLAFMGIAFYHLTDLYIDAHFVNDQSTRRHIFAELTELALYDDSSCCLLKIIGTKKSFTLVGLILPYLTATTQCGRIYSLSNLQEMVVGNVPLLFEQIPRILRLEKVQATSLFHGDPGAMLAPVSLSEYLSGMYITNDVAAETALNEWLLEQRPDMPHLDQYRLDHYTPTKHPAQENTAMEQLAAYYWSDDDE